MTIETVVNYIFGLFESAITFYLFYKLLAFRDKGKKSITLLIISAFLYSILIYNVSSLNIIVKFCLFIVLLTFANTFIFKDNILIKSFFVILILYELVIIDLIIGNLFAFLLGNTALDVFYNSLSNQIFFSVIAKIVDFIFVYVTVKVFKPLDFDISKKYWLFLNIITLIFLIITICFISVYATLHIDSEKSIYFFILSVCFLFVSCLVIYFFSVICNFFQKEKQLYITEMTNKALQQQINLQESMSNNVKKMKHDIKNNLLNISFLLSEEKYDDVNKYICELNSSIEQIANISGSGNSVIDAIVSCKALSAERNDIKLILKIEKLPPVDIPYTALASILSNLLDNALEALANVQDDKKIIILKIAPFKGYISIIVRNYYNNILQTENDIIKTTKSDKSLHGFGLKLIQDAATQNGGYFTYTAENNEFTANVLLPIE